MVRRKHRDDQDDYIGPAKGWAKFFHRVFLFVTFPLRKPWWTLLILLIMFLAPTFAGVKPTEVHLWYWKLLKNSTEQVSGKAKNIVAEMPKLDAFDNNKKSEETVNVLNKSSGRKVFEKAKAAPIVKTIKTDTEVPAQRSIDNNNSKISVKNMPSQKNNLGLVYLEEPKKISGTAVVINANEMVVSGVELFLYGIYVKPYSTKGKQATQYLYDNVNGKKVDCFIKAYTKASVATAICVIGDKNINRELVELGYSKNVALD
ncbi:MAG: hypothetical protein E7012_01290 [Alphaproteobacteria bacterium]|nr:hypothetical protein [Alphaproteobacteria bacterium]